MANKVLGVSKQYYDVKVEALLPATLIIRVLAETPQQAIELSKRYPPNVKYRVQGAKWLKASVYDSGTNLLRLVKNLVGNLR